MAFSDFGLPAEALDDKDQFESDVIAGLSRAQKSLPSKYLYDEMGSALFERISDLDEYYLTRAELEIMEKYADSMAEIIGPRCMLIELGSGSGLKTQLLLDNLKDPAAYVPIEISESALYASVERLKERYPELLILPVAGDYMAPFHLPRPPGRVSRRVVYFPGSTIGNMEPRVAESFLRRMAALCGPGGGMLVGVDLKKSADVLNAAYNDASGVTAAFNLNLLVRMNRDLDADFKPEHFEHKAFYSEAEGRIEMHLISSREQEVRIGDHTFRFAEGESIVTEYSYKYEVEEFSSLAGRAGFCVHNTWLDEGRRFSVHYLQPY